MFIKNVNAKLILLSGDKEGNLPAAYFLVHPGQSLLKI